MAPPRVTVLIITYNHEAYIAQAVESVLMQQADFEFEVLISEDCSSDATREIVKELRNRWPERIRLLLSERNQCDNEVLVRGFRAARGEYIAVLEGDDFWTSPCKLQRQVQFLDEHPECAFCFHDVDYVYEPGVAMDECGAFRPPSISTLRDLLEHGNFIETCSVMYRQGLVTKFPEWYRQVFCSDWVLHILHAEHGAVGRMDGVLAAYRIHSGGVWTSLDSAGRCEKNIEAYTAVEEHLGSPYHPVLRKVLATLWYDLATLRLAQGQTEVANICVKQGLSKRPYNPKLLLLLYAPWLLRMAKRLRGWTRSMRQVQV